MLMIYKKECPQGLDIWIKRLQEDLYDYLLDEWNLRDKDYNCYGRAYRNRKATGYVPELYLGNGEYKELLLDDKVAVHSFFGIGNNIVIDNYKSQTADVHLVFFVNLEAIKNTSHRADVEARLDVYNMLKLEFHQFILKSEVTGVEKVLEEYTGRDQTNLIQFDTHPWHCFRFNMRCTYDPITQ
jgi:hypothetical protein